MKKQKKQKIDTREVSDMVLGVLQASFPELDKAELQACAHLLQKKSYKKSYIKNITNDCKENNPNCRVVLVIKMDYHLPPVSFDCMMESSRSPPL